MSTLRINSITTGISYELIFIDTAGLNLSIQRYQFERTNSLYSQLQTQYLNI